MTPRAARKTLVAAVDTTREIAADLTQAIASDASPPLLRARAAMAAAVIELNASLREFDEQRDPERTPLRPPSRTDVKAAFATANEHSEAAAAALKGSK